jgi:arylsulfatase A-like enzyme
MSQPNILWICSDQQRFDTLGCYGNQFVQTPNIDRLAQSGVLFEQAYSQSPVCTPSRASFLSGRYPRATRCRQNGQSIPEDEILVTRLLAENGYVCGLSGKLHLSVCHPKACPVTERRINDGYSDFHWSHHPDGVGNGQANEYHQWLRERGASYQRKSFRGSKYVETSVAPEHHQTTWCADKAIEFMQANGAKKKPWLFSVNIFDPHHPFDPPEALLTRHLEALSKIPTPNYVPGELNEKLCYQQIDHRGGYGATWAYDEMTPDDHRLITAAYWAMCELIDVNVGRMIAALEKTGQLDNTIVIYMSDHGEMLGDHGFYLKGPHFYDPAIHVPLIVSFPAKIKGGRRSRALVELADLAPMLLDAADIKRHPGMQGQSIWPLLTGSGDIDQHRDDVYCEFYNSKPVPDHKAHLTMLRTAKHKLVAAHGLPASEVPGELYDLERDPLETHNLWNDREHLQIKCELLQRLCSRMAFTVDPLPVREGPW